VQRLLWLILLACLTAVPPGLTAQESSKSPGGKSPEKKSPEKEKAKKETARRETATTLPSDRERAARKFAEEHHPELAKLLKQLQENAPREYADAVAELDRTRDRLEKNRERQPERYEAELSEWKLTSRIRLTLARMAMNDDPQLESELRAMVRERQDLRLQLLRTERDRIEKRLDKIRSVLAEAEKNPDRAVDRELASLKKGIPAAQARAKTKPKGSKGGASSAVAKPAGAEPEKGRK
jgi:hypothetical protein